MENEKKRIISLYTLFRRMFLLVLAVAVLATAWLTYSTQERSYHTQYREELHNLNNFILQKILEDGDDFRWLQEWFGEHMDELEIPFRYPDNASAERDAFLTAFAAAYPGKAFGADVKPDEMDSGLQLLYARCRFLEWLTTFDKVRDEYGLVFAYYVYPTPGMEDHMCYMFDAPREEIVRDGKSLLVVGFDAYQDRKMHENMWKAYDTGRDPGKMDIYENEYGHVLTYATPVVYEGEVLGVFMTDIGFSVVEGRIRKSTLLITGLSLLILGICFSLILIFVRRAILRRLSSLEKQVAVYARGKDPQVAQAIRGGISSWDEIGTLADEFAGMILQLQDYMANLSRITAEKERIEAELTIAREIQESMLPRILPPFSNRQEFELYAAMDPAKEVGGDFYDFFLIDKYRMAILIADVSGKGVPAALFMAISKALIKDQAQEIGVDPAAILTKSNELLSEGNDKSLFVTVWLGILDLRDGHMIYSDAGHENPLLLRRDGETVTVKPRRKRPPLAALEGITYLNEELTLVPGDTLLLYTDGVAEATNRAEAMYGMDRLISICSRNIGADAHSLLVNIRADVDSFVGDAEQFDDLTMLALKLNSFQEADDE